MLEIYNKPCPKCGGSGEVPDALTGRRLRAARLKTDVSIRKLAGAMGLSWSYVRDVEVGNRPANHAFVRTYTQQLERVSNGIRR